MDTEPGPDDQDPPAPPTWSGETEWLEFRDPRLADLHALATEPSPETVELIDALVNLPGLPARYAVDPGVTNLHQRSFLVAYATNGANVTIAAQAAGIHRRKCAEWKRTSPVFAEALQDAHEAAVEQLEAEAHRRSVLGILEPVFMGGEQVGVKRKFSDTLLVLRLKSLAPERYADATRATVVHSGTIAHDVTVDVKAAARARIEAKALQLAEAAQATEELLEVHEVDT